MQAVTDRVQFPVIILTGLSGSGKSTALKVFEDLGFFCVDGLPAGMVTRLVGLLVTENPRDFRGLALGMDIRQPDFILHWQQTLDWLAEEHIQARIFFLVAEKEILMRRYAETRRPHPLESRDVGLDEALEREQEQLDPLFNDADHVIDTSAFSIHDLRRHLQELWLFGDEPAHGLRVHVVSFGFKFGIPKESDLVFDLRFLPNPHFVEGLRELSGRDASVADYVLAEDPGRMFLEKLVDFLLSLLPLYAQEGRYRMTIAVGCTGGRHRSVAVAERLFAVLKKEMHSASVEHKHLELG